MPGFTNVFGGELIFPSLTSYISITTAVDITLAWPTEQQIGGPNVVADIMDLNATAPSLNVDMPSASAVGTGNKATINNIGSNTFNVRDNTGGSIISIAPGEQWVIVLTDNTTVAGIWTVFQLGATVSVANASALAGAGIKAISTTLNQQIDSDVEGVTPFTVVDGDRAKCLIYTAGAGTANLPSAAAVGNDWFFLLRNSGSGTLNVLPPSGNINGASSINMDPGDSAFIFTDGTNWFTVGFGQGNTLAFDFVSIAIPGSGDFVLSGANLDRVSYRFTGLLTGNRKIVVPNTVQQYWIDNQTTGSFALTVGTAAGAAPAVVQGQSVILYSDATDVINASSSTSISFPVTVGQGGTGSTTASGARTNLGVPPDTRDLIAGVGLAGGGDLTADRTFTLDVGDLVAETAIAFDDELALEDVSAGLTRKATAQNVVEAVVQGRVKPTFTSRANDDSSSADPKLAGFILQPSAEYIVELALSFTPTAGDLTYGYRWAFDFNGQDGNVDVKVGVGFSFEVGNDTATIDGGLSLRGASQLETTFPSILGEQVVGHYGIVTGASYVGGTALDLVWAQGFSNANATNLLEGSSMIVTRVA